MAMALNPVPQGNVTQALNAIAQNFILVQAAINQYLAQTSPIANPSTAQGLNIPGKVTSYIGQVMAGNGLGAVVAYARRLGQTTAIAKSAPLLSYPVGAVDGSFILLANTYAISGTDFNYSIEATLVAPESPSTSIAAQPLPLLTATEIGAGTFSSDASNLLGLGVYYGMPLFTRCKALTTITIYTAGSSFTSVTYDIEATIIQIA
jgi:hypothetical protein